MSNLPQLRSLPLCCLIHPLYLCRECRATMCQQCATDEDIKIRAMNPISWVVAIRQSGHIAADCFSRNDDKVTTWEKL
jgi:hypothetical protein